MPLHALFNNILAMKLPPNTLPNRAHINMNDMATARHFTGYKGMAYAVWIFEQTAMLNITT